MKKLLYLSTILLGLTTIFLTACKKDKENPYSEIPEIKVNFTIQPNSTLDYIEIGSYAYYTGGYRGIIIYRTSPEDFKAYERACPYDAEESCAQVEVMADFLTAIDSCCMTKYLLLDGTPTEGPGTLPLKQYQAIYDGVVLHVFN